MELLKQRLVAMYKMNRAGITQSIFAPNFANEFSRRYKYVNKVIDHDTTLLKDYNENQLLLEAEKIRLKEFQEEIGSLKDAVEKKKEEIKEEKDKKKGLPDFLKNGKGDKDDTGDEKKDMKAMHGKMKKGGMKDEKDMSVMEKMKMMKEKHGGKE